MSDDQSAQVGTTFEFDESFQDKILTLYSRDTTFAKRVNGLMKPEYFTNEAHAAFFRICQRHLEKFGATPDKQVQLKILKEIVSDKKMRPDLFTAMHGTVIKTWKGDLTNAEYVAHQVQIFARHQAIQQAMMTSIPLLDKGEFSKIRELMLSATQVGLTDDFEDYQYFKEIKNRTAAREDIANGVAVTQGITTGYSKMDCHLYHQGWGRKELSCLMGAAKSGKSLGLGDFAKNASLAGFNVLYVSLEVSKEIISGRIDAALSDTLMSELVNDRAKVDAAIIAAHTNAGDFRVIDFPSGQLKVSALNRVLEKYRDKGIVFDLVCVDYADIMARERSSDDLQEGLRNIYIDLRAMAHNWNIAVLTATQTNREGAKAATAKATDVGDDWNKVRTVDILIGINATDAEKAIGEARLFWAISRNTADGFSIKIKQDRQRMQFIKDIIGVIR